jgi:hypothetical protein
VVWGVTVFIMIFLAPYTPLLANNDVLLRLTVHTRQDYLNLNYIQRLLSYLLE